MVVTGLDLAEQLDWHWSAQLRPRLDGLSDDEYLWQPVAGAWSVHPQPGGGYAPDWESPSPKPPPFTNIAWRVCHVWAVLLQRADFHFGQGVLTFDRLNWPGTAASALDALDYAYATWRSGLEACDGDAWERRRVGPPGTADADYPFWAVVSHVNREVIHHGAEIALLRDLYAASAATR